MYVVAISLQHLGMHSRYVTANPPGYLQNEIEAVRSISSVYCLQRYICLMTTLSHGNNAKSCQTPIFLSHSDSLGRLSDRQALQ
jgi:hypothetical protein